MAEDSVVVREAPSPKELSPKKWDGVTKTLTRDALLGQSSPVFRGMALTGVGHWNVERFMDDTFLVNEHYNASLLDPKVFENFEHFRDIFEDLSQEVDPARIQLVIKKSIEDGEPPPGINQRIGELGDVVIGRFFIGPEVERMTEGDVEELRTALNQDTTAGWIFMFHLLKIPSRYMGVAFMSSENPSASLEEVVNEDATSTFERISRGKDDSFRERLSNIEQNVYPFLERYLDNPLLSPHLISYLVNIVERDPGPKLKGALERFIEKQVGDPELVETAREIRAVPEPWRIKEIVAEYGSLITPIRGGNLLEATVVNQGTPLDRIVVHKVVPEEVKGDYEESREVLKSYVKDYGSRERPSLSAVKLAWERYQLAIDKMLIHVVELESKAVFSKDHKDRWDKIGNYAWKLRHRRPLTPGVIEQREERIKKIEDYLS